MKSPLLTMFFCVSVTKGLLTCPLKIHSEIVILVAGYTKLELCNILRYMNIWRCTVSIFLERHLESVCSLF